jgi:hypothetical protein
MYNKYVNKTEINNETTKEIKFYKKRIYDLVKKMLTSKEERNKINADVNLEFNNFIQTAINYFKIIDKQDIQQKYYEGCENLEDETEDEDEDEDYNAYIMKKINFSIKNDKKTLDNFVIRKEAVKELIVYPIKREFNLKDESLKNKGIKKKEPSKKKKINNKYGIKEEKCEDKTNFQQENEEK